MPLFSFEGTAPTVHADAFIAPTATLVGDVIVEAGASVWYNAVVRADFQPIVIHRGANVQDCSVLHVNGTQGVEIGPGATIGAGSTITKNAPDGELTLARSKQVTIPGWQRPKKRPKPGK